MILNIHSIYVNIAYFQIMGNIKFGGYMWISKLKEFCGIELNQHSNENCIEEFEKQNFKHNRIVIRIVAVVSLIIECINIYSLLFASKNGLGTVNNRIYFGFYITLTITLIIALIIEFIFRDKEPDKKFRDRISFMYVIYCFMFMLWGGGITLMDLRHNNNIIVYSFIIVCVSVLFYFKPYHLFWIFVGAQAMFIAVLSQLPKAGYTGAYINTTMIALISLVIAYMRYIARQKHCIDTQTILNQSEEIRQMNMILNGLVIKDALTGLYNRRFLSEEYSNDWISNFCNGEKLSVVMLDIDDFKKFNDKHGHQSGDECLRIFSEILKSVVRSKEGYVIRYGGEEFLLILWGLDNFRVDEIAESIRNNLENTPIKLFNSESMAIVTVSIGIHNGVVDSNFKLDAFINNADTALYNAKHAGKNQAAVFDI